METPPPESIQQTMRQPTSLQEAAQTALAACVVEDKLDATQALAARWQAGDLLWDEQTRPLRPEAAGRPPQPHLVSPRELPKRGLGTPEGRAALLHAVAHIEFNAINLALDAVQRFAGLPRDYYNDWVQVAAEEAQHFGLMRKRLRALGFDYGDFPAHNGLWEMATATADDVLARMALVPRGLEARGLDVTPGMIERLREVGDHPSAEALGIILHDEVGHVAAGSRWFAYLCAQRALDPAPTYIALLRQHMKGRLPCPVNFADRRRAGFDQAELEQLARLCAEV
ncbi:ferritin-like domain-containing protein [Thiorhodovibrio frisius]|uniref:Ferritin-like domain-containing protein n=1 Tax=Thiorhodovibrio frisius TaxID=631362 RepID=H8Z559_9GAMM|nr:ferritin-like domain-containing protein [Thiorhodovibrio frisius]EIC20466.1 hypothetical protein Thi970DRAFT_04103 [Thiorhodovibrio frisius]WPL21210.1 hypothetical protein Thiofri_01321 [Thiorhodovibrio frisius]